MMHLISRYLYEVNRDKQRWLNDQERKHVRWFIAVFTFIAIVVLAWILRP